MAWQIDTSAILAERARRLAMLQKDRRLVVAAKQHYKTAPWDFVNDWGMTFDPRLVEAGEPANIPFIPWPRQIEYMRWLYERWQSGERGLVEKSRDCGVTWLSVGFAVALWAFRDGVAIGFGSRKEDLVDRLGDPDSIFEKIRHFVAHVPAILLPAGYSRDKHSSYQKIVSPTTGSSITGEAGDSIGRGGRKSIYFVDEAAFIDRQEMVDAALSQSTNCQIDISTFSGTGNAFYRKQQRFQGTKRHFVFDWRSDLRKDDAWYSRQKDEQTEETVAQEIDRDPTAANIDSFIPAKWVTASIDAHKRIGFDPSGIRTAGFDPADTGDSKAIVLRYGSVIVDCQQLKSGDITDALPWAYEIADQHRADLFIYDADGMGAPAIKIDIARRSAGRFELIPYRGSGEVRDKLEPSIKGDQKAKVNGDIYYNFRGQSWTWARERFRLTYEAITRLDKGLAVNVDPDKLISLSSDCKALHALRAELSAPRRKYSDNGKILVESKKDMRARRVQSPNLSDALIMSISESKPGKTEINSFEPDFYA